MGSADLWLVLVLVVVLYGVVVSLRRRVTRLEGMVLRLQDQMTDLRFAPGAEGAESPAIDVEPFVE